MPVNLIKIYITLRFSCLCLTGTELHIYKCNNFWSKVLTFENFEPLLSNFLSLRALETEMVIYVNDTNFFMKMMEAGFTCVHLSWNNLAGSRHFSVQSDMLAQIINS